MKNQKIFEPFRILEYDLQDLNSNRNYLVSSKPVSLGESTEVSLDTNEYFDHKDTESLWKDIQGGWQKIDSKWFIGRIKIQTVSGIIKEIIV